VVNAIALRDTERHAQQGGIGIHTNILKQPQQILTGAGQQVLTVIHHSVTEANTAGAATCLTSGFEQCHRHTGFAKFYTGSQTGPTRSYDHNPW
jgi:hypothetical protein